MQKIKVKCPAKTTSALDEQSEELEMRRPELVSGSRGLRVQCPAKINLTLEILNKREDGFHNIQSVMQTINLYDYLTISVEESEKFGIKLSGTSDEIPYDETNLVHKAVELFVREREKGKGKREKNHIPFTLHLSPFTITVHIEKNIPISAGLAGGSTDAAGVLYGLNKLFEDVFSKEQLHELCSKLGSDLNFCLEGGCQLATGRGEVLEKLPFQEFSLSLVKPKLIGISAREAYTKFSALENKPNLNMTKEMVELLNSPTCDAEKIKKLLYNDLETAVIDDYQILQLIKKQHPKSIMSGSGSTFFVVGEDKIEFPSDIFWVKTGLKSIPHGVKTVPFL